MDDLGLVITNNRHCAPFPFSVDFHDLFPPDSLVPPQPERFLKAAVIH
jgi:hypothetical protein